VIAALLALAVAAGPLTPAELSAVHVGVRRLSAEVVQTKTGAYLARPLRSRIRLTWDASRIAWRTLEPVASSVVIEGERVRLEQGGRVREFDGAGGDPRVRGLIGFVRALVAFDLPAIERDFALQWGERRIVATARPGRTELPFREVMLHFDERLEIASIDLVTDADLTHLEFTRIERDR
jgi:hypothetical protein